MMHGVLAWMSFWSEVPTCIWPSWCHCHSLSLALLASRLDVAHLDIYLFRVVYAHNLASDNRLQWARGLPGFSLFGVCTLRESKILKIIYFLCQYFNDGWTDFRKKYISLYLCLEFFRKPGKLGSHTGSE